MSARALITGGAGFVGTNLARRLAASGSGVRIFDSLAREGSERNARALIDEFRDRIEIVVADIRDASALSSAMAGVTRVYHLAAQVAVTTSLDDPLSDFDVNARGTLNVLEAARASSPQPVLLFTSTNKVYGALRGIELERAGSRYLPIDPSVRASGVGETQLLDFQSPYGCSKGAADQYVLDFARSFGLPTVVLRMSCIYGPHQNGTEDQGWVAHFVRKVMAGEPITIYGDGAQVRDLLFVDDLCDAFERAFDHIDELRGRAFNIGGGPDNAVSVLGVVDYLHRISRRAVEIRHGRWRVGDQRYYVTDFSRFEAATGWRPCTTVAAGLAALCDWFGAEAGIELALRIRIARSALEHPGALLGARS